MPASKPRPITVQFHLGAEHTAFDANITDTLASLKQTALNNLNIVADPSIDYLLSFRGQTVENETQTLGQLLGEHARPHVEFHIKKRPKGGQLVTADESEALLLQRWPAVEGMVRSYGGDPAADLLRDLGAAGVRDRLVVHVRIRSAAWIARDGVEERDTYWFKLDFTDYDEHAPRIWVCDPEDHRKVGTGKQFYPAIPGNNVFNHDTFLCMPGDRRCYEASGHQEWRKKEHYHPDIVIGSLFELIRSPTCQRRKTS